MNHSIARAEIISLGSADIVVAGGGIVGVIAAGELALAGYEVLLLESRSTLLHEIVRAQLPVESLFSAGKQSSWLQQLEEKIREMAPRHAQPFHPFSLELAAEELLFQQGVKLLYYAFPAGWNEAPTVEQTPLEVIAGVRGGSGSIEARQAVIDATSQAVLLREAGYPADAVSVMRARQIMKWIDVESADAIELDVATSRGVCHLRLPKTDARGRALIEVEFEMKNPSLHGVEFLLAEVVEELIPAIRQQCPAYQHAGVAFIGDEPYIRPSIHLSTAESTDGVVQLHLARVFGAGLWSMPQKEKASLQDDVASLTQAGLALSQRVKNSLKSSACFV